MHRLKIIAPLCLLAIVAIYWFWPVPLVKQLEARFQNLCNLATINLPLSPMEARFKAKDLISIFADSIELHYQSPEEEFSRTYRKQELMDAMSLGLVQLVYGKVGFARLKVVFSGPENLEVSLFLVAEWQLQSESEHSKAAEDTHLWLIRQGREWKIRRIETYPRVTIDQ